MSSLQSLPIELLTAILDSLEQARTDAARLIQRMTRAGLAGLRVRSKLTSNLKFIMNSTGRRPILGRNSTITQLARVWKRDGRHRRHLVDILPIPHANNSTTYYGEYW